MGLRPRQDSNLHSPAYKAGAVRPVKVFQFSYVAINGSAVQRRAGLFSDAQLGDQRIPSALPLLDKTVIFQPVKGRARGAVFNFLFSHRADDID